MDKHKQAGQIEHCIQIFHRIKQISGSSVIDDLCVKGISKLIDFAGVAGLQEQLDELRQRRIND